MYLFVDAKLYELIIFDNYIEFLVLELYFLDAMIEFFQVRIELF